MPLPLLLVQSLVDELDREGNSTARLLERVPLEHLDWTPHPRSTTLGDLAWHIAAIPRVVSGMLRAGTFDLAGASPSKREGTDFVGELRRNLDGARRLLESLDQGALLEPFTITRGGIVVVTMPAAALIRTIMLNHSVHHRGQLTVYLRMLDVPLPAIYGSSADEKP